MFGKIGASPYMNVNITAFVLTLNEERRLPLVIKNLSGFCKIVVFDGGSTDKTEEICKRNNIEFISRPRFDTNLSNEPLKWILKQIETDYVLHVSTAHFYPYKLLSELSNIANKNIYDAVFHDVIIYKYGSIVQRPLIRRISSGCNFYKKHAINLEVYKIHANLNIEYDEERMIRLAPSKDLSLHLFHDYDCETFTLKTIQYAVQEARQRFTNGERVGYIDLFIKPFMLGMYRHLRLGSVRYGLRGLVHTILDYIYQLQVTIIIWELQNNLTDGGTQAKNESTRSVLLDRCKYD